MTTLLTPHEHADFDAFSALLAVRHLYPDAISVLSRPVTRPVRDFLALHKNRFQTVLPTDVNPEGVDRLVVVDTRRRSRVPVPAPVLERAAKPVGERDIEVVLYDHHRSSPDDLVGDHEEVVPLGAVTTLLCEKLKAQRIQLDALEATALLTGIYSDTGALQYPNTTARDAEAVAWLLRHGAQLQVVARYLRHAYTPGQRLVLSQLLGRVERFQVGGVSIGLATLEIESMIPGLSPVVSEIMRLEGHDAVIAVFGIPRRKRVQVVGRAIADWIDVGTLLGQLGGGGHRGAAAATVKKRTANEVAADIRERLLKDPPRPRTVGQVMSSPVLTVLPDDTVRAVLERLTEAGYSGAPVVRDGRLTGVVSRRDLASALDRDQGEYKVASCMTHEVVTVAPDAPLQTAVDKMERSDVGRLPVMVDEHFVGIVTRTDVLSTLYPTDG